MQPLAQWTKLEVAACGEAATKLFGAREIRLQSIWASRQILGNRFEPPGSEFRSYRMPVDYSVFYNQVITRSQHGHPCSCPARLDTKRFQLLLRISGSGSDTRGKGFGQRGNFLGSERHLE